MPQCSVMAVCVAAGVLEPSVGTSAACSQATRCCCTVPQRQLPRSEKWCFICGTRDGRLAGGEELGEMFSLKAARREDLDKLF